MKIFKRSCSVNQKEIITNKYERNFIPHLYVYMSWLLMKMLLKKKIFIRTLDSTFYSLGANFENFKISTQIYVILEN